MRFLFSLMQHWHALPEARGKTNAPAQPHSSWTSRRYELAAHDLIYADKVKYPPAHPPMPWAMVATYAAPRIATSFLGVSWYRGFMVTRSTNKWKRPLGARKTLLIETNSPRYKGRRGDKLGDGGGVELSKCHRRLGDSPRPP